MMNYVAITYAVDGHGEPSEIVCTGTLDECREAVIKRLSRNWGNKATEVYRWSGLSDDGDVEAYHESDDEGCGGVAIRLVAAIK